MSTKTISVNGTTLEVRAPYAAGHVLTEAEAIALNQTRAENVGNSVRKAIKDAGDDQAALAAAVAKAQEYDAAYDFSVRVAGERKVVDPVEREARAIAKTVITAKLAETNRTFKKAPDGYTDETWADYLDGKIGELASAPAILKEAKKRVDAKRKTTDDALAGLEL